MPEILRGLDCFVLPSLAEGISNTILEAMACGLPVIATDVGGNAELIAAGVTGTLVASGDVPSMAAEIVRLSQQKEKRAKWARAGGAGRAEIQHGGHGAAVSIVVRPEPGNFHAAVAVFLK